MERQDLLRMDAGKALSSGGLQQETSWKARTNCDYNSFLPQRILSVGIVFLAVGQRKLLGTTWRWLLRTSFLKEKAPNR